MFSKPYTNGLLCFLVLFCSLLKTKKQKSDRKDTKQPIAHRIVRAKQSVGFYFEGVAERAFSDVDRFRLSLYPVLEQKKKKSEENVEKKCWCDVMTKKKH